MREKKKKNSSATGVGFFSRMSTKMTLLSGAIVLVTVLVLVISAANKASTAMQNTYLNYAQNLAEEAAVGVDFATDLGEKAYGGYTMNLAEEAAVAIDFSRSFGEEVYKNYAQNLAEEAAIAVNLAGDTSTEGLNRILKGIAIKDVEGSYAYMVSPTGVMLWHPTTEKIGNPVENEAVKGIVADLAAGKTVENGAVLYIYKDALKLAGYAFTNSGNIMIVTADYDQFMKIDYDELLGNITIDGVEGSYAYMVSPDGTMMWHPTTEKIGQPVENAAVQGIVADLAAGKTVDDGYVVYDYKGAKKMAGYSFSSEGNIVLVTADYDKLINIDYDSLLGNIEISGVEGSYAYMVSPEGTMLWHTDAEKIGNPVENAAVKGIVEQLAAGKTVENGACIYEYKGADKVAGYAFTGTGNIIVVTADKDVMLKDVSSMKTSMVLFGIVCMIIAVAAVAFASIKLLGRLDALVAAIYATADLNLTDNEASAKLEKSSDEVGAMAKAVSRMHANLRNVVSSINVAGTRVDSNVDELQLTIDGVGDRCRDNSATTQQLAAGMQETAATTTAINNNVENVQRSVNDIRNLTDKGASMSGEVLSRALELGRSTDQASKKTMDMYESVKVKSEKAIEASKSVNKINELTETIMAISSQTSLLALNASIEAARAGDSGRGFAVVASEISTLAKQTEEAVNSIFTIVSDVQGSVDQLSDCLTEATSFLGTNVLSDYNDFAKVSERYKDDADSIGNSMRDIKNSLVELEEEINNIAESITGIDSTVNEAATGVFDISGKTTEMVDDTIGSADKVAECKQAVEELNKIIDKFTF